MAKVRKCEGCGEKKARILFGGLEPYFCSLKCAAYYANEQLALNPPVEEEELGEEPDRSHEKMGDT